MATRNGIEHLSSAELGALLSHIRSRADSARKKGTTRAVVDELIILLLVRAGLRPNELCSLKIGDLYWTKGQMALQVRAQTATLQEGQYHRGSGRTAGEIRGPLPQPNTGNVSASGERERHPTGLHESLQQTAQNSPRDRNRQTEPCHSSADLYSSALRGRARSEICPAAGRLCESKVNCQACQSQQRRG